MKVGIHQSAYTVTKYFWRSGSWGVKVSRRSPLPKNDLNVRNTMPGPTCVCVCQCVFTNVFSVVWAQWIRIRRKIFSHRFCVCMHALRLGDVVCVLHVETLCCLFTLYAWAVWSDSARYFNWILWVVIILSATLICSEEQFSFQVCKYILIYQIFWVSKLSLVCLTFLAWVTHAAPVLSVKGAEPIRDLPRLHC